MQWIRCNVCNNLKQETEFYMNCGIRRKTCKKCMKLRYPIDKKNKKEYDSVRYLKNKINKKERNVCMRCSKYYVNVKNGALEWCFECHKRYEDQYNQKIKVEIISSVIRKVKNL